MTSKLTRLTDEELAELAFYAGESTCHPDPNYQLGFESLATGSSVLSIVRELQERRKAAMDSEPVYQYQSGVYNDDNGETDWYWDDCDKGFYEQYAHDRRRILYRHAQPVVPDDVQRDAKRWRALLGSARIRILGSAGFDATAHPGENPDYRHFGMEIWTHYPNWLHEKNEYGIDTLTQYADAMLAAAPQEVK
ncbi:TPA: hypothetical protein L9Q72_003117 [Klebsiella pneumoniae]|nr:hypothetical protein [Klebsiella pneumoniae]